MNRNIFTIICKCGSYLNIKRPGEMGRMKSYAHCAPCNLEWHLTWDRQVYSHPWKINGLEWHLVDKNARMAYLRKSGMFRKRRGARARN